MLDLKTGRFVIDAQKMWELHPFMTREAFLRSDLFHSDYLIKHKSFGLDDPFFGFKPIDMDGQWMYMTVYVGGRHDCVSQIELTSMESYDFRHRPYDVDWESTALGIKRMHDEFLMREVGLEKKHVSFEKFENWYNVEWGSFRSSICLLHEPDISITIEYDNLTEADRHELDGLPDEICWS
ncbi:MAG: hypothetical protein IK131_12765 [Paludibacteraceae bacterium]|nr:hypothetical protein [Paludibacteraceae bacterium]